MRSLAMHIDGVQTDGQPETVLIIQACLAWLPDGAASHTLRHAEWLAAE